MTRSFVLRMLWGCAALTCAADGTAQAFGASTVTLDQAASSLVIEPGATGRLVFDVHAGTAGPAIVAGFIAGEAAWLDDYAFEPETPTCAAPVVTRPGVLERIEFDAGMLALGASVRCAYRVVRSPVSRHDVAFHLCPPGTFPLCAQVVQIGTLPDLALTVTPLDTPSLVRVTVANNGTRDVRGATLATECAEFEGGFLHPAPFDVVGDVAGGCPRADTQRVGCLNFTGMNNDSRNFAIGPIAAGGSASCLLRLVPTASAVPAAQGTIRIDLLGDPSTFFGVLVASADGSTGFDRDVANNAGVLGGSAPASVPVGGGAGLLLALVLLAFAALRLRGVN